MILKKDMNIFVLHILNKILKGGFKMKKISKIFLWVPRILAILYIIFLAIFSLDVISSESTFIEIFVGLFIHNIPVFILIIALIMSWKTEIIGAIVFLIYGFFYIVMVSNSSVSFDIYLSWILAISGPAFLISILFFISWFKKSKKI